MTGPGSIAYALARAVFLVVVVIAAVVAIGALAAALAT